MINSLLTATRLKDARACQRLHKYKYIDGYRAIAEAEALRFGTLWHKGLEAWWLAPAEERLERALAVVAEKAVDPFDLARVQELLRGYHYRWQNEPLETLAIEATFATELKNPITGRPSSVWRLGGKVDGIVRDLRAGRVLLLEHKTTSEGDISAGSNYWKRLRLDGQVSIYFDGAVALGYPVEACLYDVVKKPTLRPYKATPLESRKYTKEGKLYATQRDADETPEEFRARLNNDIASDPRKYFARGEIVRLERELEDSRFDLWQIGEQLYKAEEAQTFPRNVDACLRFNGACDFFPVCSNEASLDDPALYRRINQPKGVANNATTIAN